MILVVKKNNIALIVLIFLLAITIYSLNFGGENATAVTGEPGAGGQRVVMLDPGHGGEDPGAVSPYSGAREKEINLAIAFKVKALLEKEGFKIIMSREEDRLEYAPGTTSETSMRKQDLTRRKNLMDTAGANIVVSIHLNKIPQTQYWGAQTFFPRDSKESQKLAGILQQSLREIVDPTNKREALVKHKANELPIIILRDLKTTTAIVECGFLSNEEEEKKLVTEAHQDKLALAISEGIKKYFTK